MRLTRPILHLPQPLLGWASLRHEKCRLYAPLQDKMLRTEESLQVTGEI
jgi:hypothetical protein